MNKSKPKAPKWVLKQEGITQKQWKSRKRQELKILLKALRKYRMGCAYCPGYSGEIGIIQSNLEELKKLQSVEKWGR